MLCCDIPREVGWRGRMVARWWPPAGQRTPDQTRPAAVPARPARGPHSRANHLIMTSHSCDLPLLPQHQPASPTLLALAGRTGCHPSENSGEMSPAGLNACITLVNLTEAVTETSRQAVETLHLSKPETKFCISATAGHKCA